MALEMCVDQLEKDLRNLEKLVAILFVLLEYVAKDQVGEKKEDDK